MPEASGGAGHAGSLGTGGLSWSADLGDWEWLPHVDLRHVEGRAKTSEDAAAAEAKRYGVGVTEHAQEVFDALSKTMDASWDGEDIEVLGIKVVKPYDPVRNIIGDNEQVVERVRKVLQSELSRRKKPSQGK